MDWYYAIDGVSSGPFDPEAMKQFFRDGKIGPRTSVWSSETGDWVPFNATTLQASAGPPPPPDPSRPSMPPPPLAPALPLPPQYSAAPAAAYRLYDNAGLSWAVRVFLGLGMFASFVSAGLIVKANGAQAKYDMAVFVESDAIVNVTLVIALITAVLFLIWLYRQTSNVWATKGPQSITPGWAVGWWFVPIMWFFKPIEALLNVYDGVEAPRQHRWLVYLWWALFWGSLVYLVLSVSYLQQSIDTLQQAQNYAIWTAIYYAIDAGTAYALLRVVKAIADVGTKSK